MKIARMLQMQDRICTNESGGSKVKRKREVRLTAIAEADHSVVALIVAQVVLVHQIQARGGHARAKTADGFEAQAKLGARLLA
jgi:ATP-dependent Zn protease